MQQPEECESEDEEDDGDYEDEEGGVDQDEEDDSDEEWVVEGEEVEKEVDNTRDANVEAEANDDDNVDKNATIAVGLTTEQTLPKYKLVSSAPISGEKSL